MKITATIEIKSTPEQVFYWLEDPDRAMQWQKSVTQTEINQETPDRIGTTFRETIEDDKGSVEMHGIMTDFVPNQRIAFHLEEDSTMIDITFTLKQKGGITQLTQQADMRFKGLLKIMSLFLGPALKKGILSEMRDELAQLKALCENTAQV